MPIFFFFKHLEHSGVECRAYCDRALVAETSVSFVSVYRGADESLARPGWKQARKHVRDARDFNNIETRAVIKFFFPPLQGKAPKEIHAILTETLACLLPSQAKDLSAPLYVLKVKVKITL